MKLLASLVVLLISTLVAGQPGIEYSPTIVFKPITELPKDVPTCNQEDLNLNECMRSLFQRMTPRIKDGIKELNIPPMDPFVIDKVAYEYANGIIQGRVAMKNLRVYGMSETVFDKVNFNMNKDHIRMEVTSHIPSLYVEGIYKADMKFNDVKMTPKGYFNVSMTDLVMTAAPEGELYERDGHSYLKLTKFDSEGDAGDVKIYASGLFPDPTLNAVILDFINQYWRQIYKTMLPETRKTWEPFMIRQANEYLSNFPLDLILKKTQEKN